MQLTKKYIELALEQESLWKVGESDRFTFRGWNLILKKEEQTGSPYCFSLSGKRDDGATFVRRYRNMETMFLHMLNRFNENAGTPDRYQSLQDALNDRHAEIE